MTIARKKHQIQQQHSEKNHKILNDIILLVSYVNNYNFIRKVVTYLLKMLYERDEDNYNKILYDILTDVKKIDDKLVCPNCGSILDVSLYHIYNYDFREPPSKIYYKIKCNCESCVFNELVKHMEFKSIIAIRKYLDFFREVE